MRFASLHLASLTQSHAKYQSHTTMPTHIAQRQAANIPKHVSIPGTTWQKFLSKQDLNMAVCHLKHLIFRNQTCQNMSVAEDWSDPAKIAKAFQIGKLESEASSNLLEKVSPTVTEALTNAVRERGMRTFLLHETLAKNLFNQGWSSNADGWAEECTNLSDNKLVDRLHLQLFS